MVPTTGSWNDMPLDVREEQIRTPGMCCLKAALRLLPLAKSSAAGGVALLDTAGMHRATALKGHSSQDNTYLTFMLAPTRGWFLV